MGKQIILPFQSGQVLVVPDGVRVLDLPCEAGKVSDGDHSYEELYQHRCLLYLAFLCLKGGGWYSLKHNDGSQYEGWFIAGITLPSGDISYHLPHEYLDIAAKHLEELERGKVWDGHTATDVLDRLKDWMLADANGVR